MDRAAESSVVIKPDKWGSQLEKRRKRRRRRRAGFERLEPEEDDDVDQVVEPVAEPVSIPVGASRSGFLSRSDEVQLCLYLKVYSFYIIYGKFSNISPWQELKNFLFLVTNRKERYWKTLEQVVKRMEWFQFCCQVLAKGRRSVALMRYYAEEEKLERRLLVVTGG